jgi:hypothetical protein
LRQSMNELIDCYERSTGRFHITYYDVKEGWISLKNMFVKNDIMME